MSVVFVIFVGAFFNVSYFFLIKHVKKFHFFTFSLETFSPHGFFLVEIYQDHVKTGDTPIFQCGLVAGNGMKRGSKRARLREKEDPYRFLAVEAAELPFVSRKKNQSLVVCFDARVSSISWIVEIARWAIGMGMGIEIVKPLILTVSDVKKSRMIAQTVSFFDVQ